MTTTLLPRRAEIAPPRDVAWTPVLVVAVGVALLLGITSSQYGPFGDETYFLSAGARLSWGYADQPPMVPLLAAAAHAVAPGSLVVLRLPATLMTAVGVVLAALITAELGGGRRAQLGAAVATAVSPALLGTGHLLATGTADPFLWTLLLWLWVRWVRTRRDGLLLAVGVVAGLALLVKLLLPFLLVGLVVGVAVAGPRRVVRRPALWAGAAVAALALVPTVWWQAGHAWPQLRMGSVVASESSLFGDRWQFLPRVLWYAGLLPGAVLLLVGLWGLLRTEALRPWRHLGIAALVTTALFLAPGGRPYYDAGLYPTLFAAGAVTVAGLARRGALPRWWSWTLSRTSFVVCALLLVLLALPIGPASYRARWDFTTMGQVGWGELADTVAARWRALPPEERSHTVVLAYSYWYASELEYEGPARGLPTPIYSAHRGFGYFDVPPDTATTALLVGKVPWATRMCSQLRPLPEHVSPIVAPVNDHVPISLCTVAAPWSRLWPAMRYMA